MSIGTQRGSSQGNGMHLSCVCVCAGGALAVRPFGAQPECGSITLADLLLSPDHSPATLGTKKTRATGLV